MAGRGPAPKDPDERRRRNASDATVVLVADGEAHGPELPDSYEWPQSTLDWWKIWRTSAQAATFTDTDWSFLIDTAVLHAEFWLGNRSLAGELRLRAAKFGATPEDRARLKIEIGDPNRPVSPTRLKTKATTNRRTRLLRAVGDGSGESADDE